MTSLQRDDFRLPDRDNLSRQVYDALRDAIVERRLRAGSKLVMRELVELLGSSPTPITQALAALEQEGLVESKPNRGYSVISLEADDVAEIYVLREAIEGLAVQLAVKNDVAGLSSRLEALRKEQVACGERRDLSQYAELDLDFHRAIWEAARNSRLLRVADTLMGQLRLLIGTSAEVPGRLGDSIDEHGDVVAHVASGDAPKAERAMRRHVRNAAKALRDFVQENSDDLGGAT